MNTVRDRDHLPGEKKNINMLSNLPKVTQLIVVELKFEPGSMASELSS